MGAKKKILITICMILIIICPIVVGVTCFRNWWGKKVEQKRQNEELRAAYPEDVKAYLEEKYGRKFCVDPKPKSDDGSPIPFAQPDYFTCEYRAWEDEEDGYAFWTEVYPVSLEDNRVLKIRDGYCWKFISSKIRDEMSEEWKEVTEEECKIITFPPLWSGIFGQRIYEKSKIKDALKNIQTEIRIFVIFPPELGLEDTELDIATEKIVTNFYNEYVKGSGCRLWVCICETYTEEDFLKIDPEISEQYRLKAKESEYEKKDWLPVELIRRKKIEMQE